MVRPFKEHDTSSSMNAAYVLVTWYGLQLLQFGGNVSRDSIFVRTWSVTLWQGYGDKI